MRALVNVLKPDNATPVRVGLAVFLASFTLFSLTASGNGVGYEPETRAVTEGLVLRGEPRIVEGSLLRTTRDASGKEVPRPSSSQRGPKGAGYGRSTITQHVLQTPFYAAGVVLDGGGSDYRWRRLLLTSYNPFVAALAAAAIFGIVLLRLGSVGWAAGISGVFSLGSIAWPYSTFGMETTLMSLLAATLFMVLLSLRFDRLPLWAVTGVVAGAAAVAKPYGILAVAPLFLPVLARVGRWPGRRWLLVSAAVALPMLIWLGAQLWYNDYRFGSLGSFGASQRYSGTLAAPFNLLGFLVSPGKGLVLYSPLVLLGLLGLPELWRRDRLFALTVITGFGLLTLLLSGSAHWSDETWGPRYIVPVAWLLLLPIPWWFARSRRFRGLAVVAGCALAVQLLAVATPYRAFQSPYRGLTGADPFYTESIISSGSDRGPGPFGRDPYRWVPELSPMVLQAEVVASAIAYRVTGEPITAVYAPFLGPRRAVRLAGPGDAFLEFWWRNGSLSGAVLGGALALAAALLWLWIAVAARYSSPELSSSSSSSELLSSSS